jgi:hypothetical protein
MIRIVSFTAAIAATLLLAGPAAAERPAGTGPPLTSGGDTTMVLHCNALGLPGFVGAIVVNRNGESGFCHFVGE